MDKFLRKKVLILLLLLGMMIVLINDEVKADNNQKEIDYGEYTDEYKQWLTLSEDEHSCVSEPRMYYVPNVTYISNNPLKSTRINNVLPTYYNLRDIIPENLVIKDQMDTDSCWSFAAIAALETTLALKDYQNGIATEVYDFSERHMAYSISKLSLTGDTSEYKHGLNRYVYNGGNFEIALLYLTNGMGAVDEESMPFVNSKSSRNINDILNKKVTAQVLDTIDFPSYDITAMSNDELEEAKNKIKYHIMNYGGVNVSVNGNKALTLPTFSIYCHDAQKCPVNHAVVIVGWDDNYSKNNFKTAQPKEDGAWIIKNSGGEYQEITTTLSKLKEKARNAYCSLERYIETCQQNGWDKDSSLITDEAILKLIDENGYVIEGDTAKLTLNGDGFFYISYEDVNIYNSASGILNALNDINYDNLYQHNYLGANYQKEFTTNDENKLYISDIFKRSNDDESEYLSQISMYAAEANTVKVYLNPNGSSIKKEDLQLVQLQAGESESFDAGYHTLEFLNPIKLTGEEFAIVLEIEGTRENAVLLKLEGYNNSTFAGKDKSYYYNVVVVDGQGAYSTDMINWNSFSNYTLDETKLKNDSKFIGADTTIKAYTLSNIKSVDIVNPANDTSYKEGDNFDKLGMIIQVTYESGITKIITDYEILNGEKLKADQNYVTISYDGIEVNHAITVEKKEEIIDSPVNSNFENASGIVENVKAYHYTDVTKEDYIVMNVKVTDIVKNYDNDSLVYYYYLSSKPNEENIDDWIKIEEMASDKDDELYFAINTKELPNYEEISSSDNLYLYIKEVAVKKNKETILISNSMQLKYNSTIEEYIDDIKQEANTNPNDNNLMLPETIDSILKYVIVLLIAISSLIIIRVVKKKC